MSSMSYWILMILLAAGCAGMLAGSFISIKKRKAENAAPRRKGRRQPNYSGNEEDQYDTARRRAVRRPEQGQNQASQDSRPQRKKKRQWKIILENIDSWEKYSFVFYDVVGIGRAREGKMYEKYLPLPSDVRVSKMHCVIIHRGDKLYLKDEESRNGTFLNGRRVDRPIVIQKDDVIGIGETQFEIQRILRESE